MRNLRLKKLASIAMLVAATATAQKFQPAAIVFKGADEFSNQELMDAAGLKLGMALSTDDVNDHAKQLMSSGMFESLGFRTDGDKLLIDLVPITQIFPLKIGNLPLEGGPALDKRLHDVCPLYHGKIAGDGGLTEDLKKALEAMLAEQKIKATITATPVPAPGSTTVLAMRMDITTPPVLIGDFKEDVGSNTLDEAAQRILAQQTGSAFDTEGTPVQVEAALKTHYFDLGYLEADIHAKPRFPAIQNAKDIRVPFSLSVATGSMYRLAGVQLAPDVVVSQADFDHQSQLHAGDIADAPHVRSNWDYIRRQYHDRGMMEAKVIPTPTFDSEKGIVSYLVTVEPGPVYTMGKLSLENVTDELEAAMLKQWKLAAGTVFDEGAIMDFFATGGENPSLARTFASAKCSYVLKLNDDKTVDVVLRLDKKASL
jgi:outer membrane protein assembly factor BamA